MTKTLNQIIFFFLHQNQILFFSNIGNQNKFLGKNHNPPPHQVKWSFPNRGNSVIIKNTIFLSIIHNMLNLRDTAVVNMYNISSIKETRLFCMSSMTDVLNRKTWFIFRLHVTYIHCNRGCNRVCFK